MSDATRTAIANRLALLKEVQAPPKRAKKAKDLKVKVNVTPATVSINDIDKA